MRANESSGNTSEEVANPRHGGESPPSGANANPPAATSPEPGAPSIGSANAPAASSRHAAAVPAKRSAPVASSALTAPSAASAHPLRSGCSSANHGSPGRRDAATIALGSAARGERAVTLTMTGDPLARDRRSANSIRPLSRCAAGASSQCPARPNAVTVLMAGPRRTRAT